MRRRGGQRWSWLSFLAGEVDGTEGGRDQGGEHARVSGNRIGDALAA